MSPITKAIDEVMFTIPRPVLEAVFINRTQNFRALPVGLDEQILNLVVRPRVMVDCNLVGGTEAFVSLDGLDVARINEWSSVYRIPKTRTQGRSIMSVLNITFNHPLAVLNYGVNASCQNTPLMQAARGLLDVHGPIPINSTARVQLIGENVVMVRDTTALPANVYLRCILANDETLSHIQARSYRPFAKLVGLAVKAYIYNEYVIEMDMGELYGGQQLGQFKATIERYVDAEELYQTFLDEKMSKILFMSDEESFSRFTRLVVGGRR